MVAPAFYKVARTAENWNRDHGRPIYVGDMGRYERGELRPHTSHKDGTNVDIGTFSCDIQKHDFDPLKAKEPAKLFIENSAALILFKYKFECTILKEQIS